MMGFIVSAASARAVFFGRYDGGTAKYGKRDQRFLHLSYIRVVRDGHYLGMCIVS